MDIPSVKTGQQLYMIIMDCLLFLKTHGTAVSCYTGEEERKQLAYFDFVDVLEVYEVQLRDWQLD